jgi:hypothetical protein
MVMMMIIYMMMTCLFHNDFTWNPGVSINLKGDLSKDQDGSAYGYLSTLEEEGDRPLGILGPGAIKALQILRSRSNTPLLLGDQARMRGLSGGTQLANDLDNNSFLRLPISRTLDALSLHGLEGLTSRPPRGNKHFKGTIGGGDPQGFRMGRVTVSGTGEYRHRPESRWRDYARLGDKDCYYSDDRDHD